MEPQEQFDGFCYSASLGDGSIISVGADSSISLFASVSDSGLHFKSQFLTSFTAFFATSSYQNSCDFPAGYELNYSSSYPSYLIHDEIYYAGSESYKTPYKFYTYGWYSRSTVKVGVTLTDLSGIYIKELKFLGSLTGYLNNGSIISFFKSIDLVGIIGSQSFTLASYSGYPITFDGTPLFLNTTYDEIRLVFTFSDLPTYKSVSELHDSGAMSSGQTSRFDYGLKVYIWGSNFNVEPTIPSPEEIIQDLLRVIISDINSCTDRILFAIRDISGFMASTPEQNQAAQDFKTSMGDLTNKIDQAAAVIESAAVRPPPEDIVPPSLDTILPTDDVVYQEALKGFGELLASSMLVDMLLVVAIISFAGYVLFGKRG